MSQSYARVHLTLEGTVTPVIALEPFPAVFFSIYQDEAGEGIVKILNRDDRPLEITQLEPARPEVPVAVNVLVKPDLYASPEVVDFGEVNREQWLRVAAMGDALTQVVGIRRRHGAFAITSVSSNIPGLDIAVSPSRPAETVRIDIKLVPEQVKQGVVSGVIRLGTTDPMFPEVAIPVRGEIR